MSIIPERTQTIYFQATYDSGSKFEVNFVATPENTGKLELNASND